MRNGSNFHVILQSEGKASFGIAVHKVAKVIFYFTGIDNHLMMTTLNGKFTKTIASGIFHRPRDIAIYEYEGVIFFTDYNCVGRIFVNGTGFMCLAGQDGNTFYPVGLAIDNIEKRLYWCDEKSYSIKSTNFDLNKKKYPSCASKDVFSQA